MYTAEWKKMIADRYGSPTPVIAWRHGSAPEVIDDQISGFVVDSIDEAVSAVHVVRGMRRDRVRQCFEARFTATRMETTRRLMKPCLLVHMIAHPPARWQHR